MVEARQGGLVGRNPNNNSMVVSAQALLKRMEARIMGQLFEKTQKALDKAELANEFKAKYSELRVAHKNGGLREDQTREKLAEIRADYLILAGADMKQYADAFQRIWEGQPLSQVLDAEKVYWESEASALAMDLLSMDSRICLDEVQAVAGESPQDMVTVGRPLHSAFPELVRVPIYGVEEGCTKPEFAWPQPGDVDPSIFQQGVRVSELKFSVNMHVRGLQIKLSNGVLSPIFEATNLNGPDSFAHTFVAKGQIVKARAMACRPDAKVLKSFTLFGENDLVMANVKTMRDESQRYEAAVPPGHTLVGLYGKFDMSAAKNVGIFGLGLILYKTEE
eukprot:TRINITY_DN34879_c0_g2_i1.p1 TRINITY_DN34879_c0_g2~~TRINITY_DN34879_c0_g2_i1.p1  ORF type:complete len:335 (-),score=62.79 TRINITY_DN34879_c0_g2_i1:138-1142(-)